MEVSKHVKDVERALELVADEFKVTPGLILTEADLQCLVYSRLRREYELRRPRRTFDWDVNGVAVHAEVSWFDKKNELRLRPDITLLNPKLLGLGNRLSYSDDDEFIVPNKDYHALGDAILLEFKFTKAKTFSSDLRKKIAADFEKIQKIRDLNSSSTFHGFVVVFGWEKHVVDECRDWINTEFSESQTKAFLAASNFSR